MNGTWSGPMNQYEKKKRINQAYQQINLLPISFLCRLCNKSQPTESLENAKNKIIIFCK